MLLLPGRIAQWVICLATVASLTSDPGVTNLIPTWSHTFMEIDHEIISTVISSLPLNHSRRVAASYKRKHVKLLVQACQGKSVVRWNDRPAMTIAVDLGRKATKTKQNMLILCFCTFTKAVMKNRPNESKLIFVRREAGVSTTLHTYFYNKMSSLYFINRAGKIS